MKRLVYSEQEHSAERSMPYNKEYVKKEKEVAAKRRHASPFPSIIHSLL